MNQCKVLPRFLFVKDSSQWNSKGVTALLSRSGTSIIRVVAIEFQQKEMIGKPDNQLDGFLTKKFSGNLLPNVQCSR